MKRFCLIGTGILFCLVSMVDLSWAELITFDDMAGTRHPQETFNSEMQTYFVDQTVNIDGFNFYSSRQYWIGPDMFDEDDSSIAYNGTDFLIAYSPLVITSELQRPFSISSLDLTNWHDFPDQPNRPANSSVTVIGTRPSGQTISATLTFDDIYNFQDQDGNDFNNFTLQGFTILQSLTLISNNNSGYDYFVVDNINISSAPVPEPATMLLFGTGLVGIVGSRLRKKK